MKLAYNHNKGFFSLHFVLFLLLVTAVVNGYALVFYAQQQKDLFRKTCFNDLPRIQTQLVRFEKQLFSLNPLSSILRQRLHTLKIQRVAAIASKNWPLAAKLTFDIQKTVHSQVRLDHVQKKIISTATQFLKTNMSLLVKNLSTSNNFQYLIWSYFVSAKNKYYLENNVQLAIQSDSIGGLAPNYELKSDYRRIQSLNLNLQHEYLNNKKFQTLLNTHQKHHFSCTVSFSRKGDEWHLAINQDKF